MLRAIIAFTLLLASLSLAKAVSGPAAITQYQTPAGALWAPFTSDLPSCEDPSVLSTITNNFYEAESLYWGGRHALGPFEKIREIGFRANGLAYVPRRYCVARAIVGDPLAPVHALPLHPPLDTVVYSIGAAEGFAGFAWGVEWCVIRFDRERAYAPDCRVLLPIIERWLVERPLPVEYGLKARY